MLQRAHLAAMVGRRLNEFTSGLPGSCIAPIALGIAGQRLASLAPFLAFFSSRMAISFRPPRPRGAQCFFREDAVSDE
jgi:hypothetical protein